MADFDESHAMRKLLWMALLGEAYISALDDAEAVDDSERKRDEAEQRGWKLHHGGGHDVGSVEEGFPKMPGIPEIDGIPAPSLSTSMDPADLQLFIDEGFAERVPDEPSSIRLTPEGMARAFMMSEFFYDALENGFDDFLDQNLRVAQGPVRIFRFRVELKECDCWREIIVPAVFSFDEFSEVILGSFNWLGYHLWDFELRSHGKKLRIVNPGQERFDPYPMGGGFGADLYGGGYATKASKGKSDPTVVDGHTIFLDEVFPRTRMATYLYDYGDGWEHSIRLLETIDGYAGPCPCCLDGEGDAPPEDVGGAGGFAQFKELLAGPDCAEKREAMAWADDQGYEPFSLNSVNARIARW